VQSTFWGVSGSIAVPGPSTVRYGGNTTCIEVRGDNNELVILDAGTGIFQLAQTLFAEFPIDINIFISHTHWDHIQGLPMFTPMFVPGNNINLYGARDIVENRSVKDVLSRQMEYSYFPLRENELKSNMHYFDIQDQQDVQIGSIKVSNFLLNHPVLNFGYRLECGGKTVVFTGDHEWPLNIYAEGDPEYSDYQAFLDLRRQQTLDFFRGADALIIDTAYADSEYPSRQGWGHGSFDASIRAARDAGVKKAFLTHHEPTRSDDQLEQVFEQALKRNGVCSSDPAFFLAQEGVQIEV